MKIKIANTIEKDKKDRNKLIITIVLIVIVVAAIILLLFAPFSPLHKLFNKNNKDTNNTQITGTEAEPVTIATTTYGDEVTKEQKDDSNTKMKESLDKVVNKEKIDNNDIYKIGEGISNNNTISYNNSITDFSYLFENAHFQESSQTEYQNTEIENQNTETESTQDSTESNENREVQDKLQACNVALMNAKSFYTSLLQFEPQTDLTRDIYENIASNDSYLEVYQYVYTDDENDIFIDDMHQLLYMLCYKSVNTPDFFKDTCPQFFLNDYIFDLKHSDVSDWVDIDESKTCMYSFIKSAKELNDYTKLNAELIVPCSVYTYNGQSSAYICYYKQPNDDENKASKVYIGVFDKDDNLMDIIPYN